MPRLMFHVYGPFLAVEHCSLFHTFLPFYMLCIVFCFSVFLCRVPLSELLLFFLVFYAVCYCLLVVLYASGSDPVLLRSVLRFMLCSMVCFR